MNTPTIDSARRGVGGFTGKMVVVGILVIICWVASLLVLALIGERTGRQAEAEATIGAQWGREQLVAGPVIVVPYYETVVTAGVPTLVKQNLYVLPSKLDIATTLEPEVRSRGIFSAPVYRASLVFSGSFAPPNLAELGVTASGLRWNEAVLAVGLSDVRNLSADPGATLAGETLTFAPGAPSWSAAGEGVHARVTSRVLQGEQPFAFSLHISGSKSLSYLPLGAETSVHAAAPWGSPSFVGAYLPDVESLVGDSFAANWHISSLGRSYPSAWKGDDSNLRMGSESAFGVNLFREVTFYTLVSRTVKYAILFIALTFLAFYLFEIMSGVRVHPFQYLLIGAALVLFYLLLLSFSEQIGFAYAYLVSSLLTIGLVTSYSASVLKARKRAWMIAAILAVLYVYLYAILQLEQYALLFGTLFLFVALAVVMRATRQVEWYKEVQ